MSYERLPADKRLEKCTLSLLTHPKYRSLAGVIMLGATTIEPDPKKCPTAYTDGRNKTFSQKAIMRWGEQELRFVVLHEAMHVALRHLVTWLHLYKKNQQLANMACDYVINLLLVESDGGEGFIKMPEEGCMDPKYSGMDSGEVFRLLEEEGKGNAGGGYSGFDQHGWDKAVGRTSEEIETLGKEVQQALQNGIVLVGNASGGLARAVGEVLAPKVDWKEQLREFVTSLCSGRDISTWRRPNRRSIDSGIYMPSSYSESIGRIVLGVDTSGSIGGEQLTGCISEVIGLAKQVRPEVLDLLYWDSKVAGHEKYGPGQYELIPDSTKPKGGGGTSPSCVTKYLKEAKLKPECVIMLTDGAVGSDWGGQWPCPVLWCVIDNKRITAKTGKTIHI